MTDDGKKILDRYREETEPSESLVRRTRRGVLAELVEHHDSKLALSQLPDSDQREVEAARRQIQRRLSDRKRFRPIFALLPVATAAAAAAAVWFLSSEGGPGTPLQTPKQTPIAEKGATTKDPTKRAPPIRSRSVQVAFQDIRQLGASPSKDPEVALENMRRAVESCTAGWADHRLSVTLTLLEGNTPSAVVRDAGSIKPKLTRCIERAARAPAVAEALAGKGLTASPGQKPKSSILEFTVVVKRKKQ